MAFVYYGLKYVSLIFSKYLSIRKGIFESGWKIIFALLHESNTKKKELFSSLYIVSLNSLPDTVIVLKSPIP